MSTFQGGYVQDMADLYTASIVSGLHSLAVSPPGWGKTDISTSLLRSIYGPEGDKWVMVRVKLATVPQTIAGVPDYDLMLQKSQYQLNRTGTVYDPRFRAIVGDELGRGNAALNDEWVEVLDRKDILNPPPVLGTSNFMPKDERAKALLDRIALWLWVSPNGISPKAVAAAQLASTNGAMTVPGRIPTENEIDFVWNATPGPQAIDAVSNYIDSLAASLKQSGYSFHPRRIWQWQRLLFRMSCWLTNSHDFATVPEEAKAYLRFAWPTQTEEEFTRWVTTLQAVIDPLTAALEQVMSDVANQLQKFADLSDAERIAKIAETGIILANANMTLNGLKIQPDIAAIPDAVTRIDKAVVQITEWYAKASQGKKVRG